MFYTQVVKVWQRWRGIIARCENREHYQYPDYGGRGIYLCEEWQDFEAFAAWMFEHGITDDLHLDRIDNDGPYSPENCHLVTRTTNNRNKRNNHRLTAFGETKTLSEWAEDSRCVVTASCLSKRLRLCGWQAEEALTRRSAKGRRAEHRLLEGARD